LEIVVRGYEDNLGEPLRAVREDVEKEWEGKVEEERKKREEAEAWAGEVVRALEKEKKVCGFLCTLFCDGFANDIFLIDTLLGSDEVRGREESVSCFRIKIRLPRLRTHYPPFKIATTHAERRWSCCCLCRA
jgi:hypothetical protein